MNGSDKTVKVTLVAVAAPYAKGMGEASSATRKLGSDIDQVNTKTKGLDATSSRASGALKGMAIGAGALAATGLVAFLTDSVRAAGDLEQSVGGVDAVFKDSADAVHAFGETAAEAVGLSRNEFNQLVTVTGAMLKNKGLEDFTAQSIDLVKVGADLAAQFGGPTSQAIEAVNAALRGESDPIERYGISLNEAAVKAELAAKGQEKLEGAALDAAKAQARIEIIMRQSADAAGAFAREADTLQGQQQRLSAEWADAKAELGTALLPALTDVTKALREGVDIAVAAGHAWESIPGPLKAAAAALVVYHLTNQRVAGGLGKAADGVRRMREELALQRALAGGITGGYQRLGDEAQQTSQKVSRAAGALGVASKAARGIGSSLMGAFGGPVGLAVVGLTIAIGAFVSKKQEAKARVEEFTAAIEADSGAIEKNTRAVAANSLEKSGAAEAAKSLGINLRDLVDASVGQADAQERVNRALDDAISKNNDQALTIKRGASEQDRMEQAVLHVREALGGTNEEIDEAVAQYQRHAEMVGKDEAAQEGLAGETDNVTRKIEEQQKKVKELADEVLRLSDAHLSAVDAEIAYQAALDEVNASIKENGETAKKGGKELDLTTESGRANAQALLDQARQAKAVAEANLEQGDSLKSLRDGMDDAREKFIENATRMGLSKTAAEDMADEFGLTKTEVDNLAKSVEDLPASKQIKIEAETKRAKAALAQLRADLAGIKDKTVTITTVYGRVVNAETRRDGSRTTTGGVTFASGGKVSGPGTGTSDSIPAWLSNGEYVIKAAAVAKYGTNLLDHINAMRFAEGGAVRYSRQPQVITTAGPSSVTETTNSPVIVQRLYANDVDDFRRRADEATAWKRGVRGVL